MKKHYNKRWLEQRWDKRQPERLRHIEEKRQIHSKKKAGSQEETKKE